ncbi:MAG TPA: cryptochrome/photolyase family protein [Kiritimatiellia bacterium]|nr:cryptochrome/photolyase family protein [Kiritimatiellia bacterium]
MRNPSEASLILPHQLFDPHPALDRARPAWLVEDSLYVGVDPHHPLNLHAHKRVLHRASMRAYADEQTKHGFTVHYLDAQPGITLDQQLAAQLPRSLRRLHLADPVDYLVMRRLQRFARTAGIELVISDTPMFLTPPAWFNPWFDSRKRYHMADFYIAQRKRLGILVDRAGKPEGGRWSFDTENRKRWPANRRPPPVYRPPDTPWRSEAIDVVRNRYPDAPGDASTFAYPVTREQARAALRHFLEHRLRGFGDYEDAISREHAVLHHAQLTPALNIGLLTPREVVDAALDVSRHEEVALNDLEGFLRQIIGWREFMRIVYEREGVRQRTANFWNHRRTLNARWYEGRTGLDPLDRVIRRVVDTAYCHHIERLMVIGNAMLVSEIHPDDVYRWFMELFIDAYDWVMVPNVYGMSQYADGGLITTKPYFSGSNYLRKMSDIPEGPWCEAWDGLFWRFIERHRDFYAGQPRLSMMVRSLDRMDPERRQKHSACAERFLAGLG